MILMEKKVELVEVKPKIGVATSPLNVLTMASIIYFIHNDLPYCTLLIYHYILLNNGTLLYNEYH